MDWTVFWITLSIGAPVLLSMAVIAQWLSPWRRP